MVGTRVHYIFLKFCNGARILRLSDFIGNIKVKKDAGSRLD